MDRRIIKKDFKGEVTYQERALNKDPQLERVAPKIRNFTKWAEDL